jgi:hypothetical protein
MYGMPTWQSKDFVECPSTWLLTFDLGLNIKLKDQPLMDWENVPERMPPGTPPVNTSIYKFLPRKQVQVVGMILMR